MMNKNEILDYLQRKRMAVAPYTLAYQQVLEKDQELAVIKKRWNIIIVILLMSGYGSIVTTTYTRVWEKPLGFLLGILGCVLIYKKIKQYFAKKEELEVAKRNFENEGNAPLYLTEKQGFPEKFYNYRDILRLYTLVEEGRCDDLKEAYNLLETQQHNEHMLSTQEEIAALQKDIARSVKVSAGANIITALNTNEIAKRLR